MAAAEAAAGAVAAAVAGAAVAELGLLAASAFGAASRLHPASDRPTASDTQSASEEPAARKQEDTGSGEDKGGRGREAKKSEGFSANRPLRSKISARYEKIIRSCGQRGACSGGSLERFGFRESIHVGASETTETGGRFTLTDGRRPSAARTCITTSARRERRQARGEGGNCEPSFTDRDRKPRRAPCRSCRRHPSPPRCTPRAANARAPRRPCCQRATGMHPPP